MTVQRHRLKGRYGIRIVLATKWRACRTRRTISSSPLASLNATLTCETMNAPSGRLVGRGRLIAMRLAAEGYRNGINGHTRFQDTVPAFECCELGRQGVWTRDKTAEHVAVVPRNKEA